MTDEQYIKFCISVARKLNRNGITLRKMGDKNLASHIINLAHCYIERARILRY